MAEKEEVIIDYCHGFYTGNNGTTPAYGICRGCGAQVELSEQDTHRLFHQRLTLLESFLGEVIARGVPVLLGDWEQFRAATVMVGTSRRDDDEDPPHP